jgi:hypothetical protein
MHDFEGSSTAVAAAPEPPPPVKVIRASEGCEKHYVPTLPPETFITPPEGDNTAVAVAPLPPPPVRLTVGADVYEAPPVVIVIVLT